MEQEIMAQGAPAGLVTTYRGTEVPNSSKSGLKLEDFIISDPKVTKKMRELVLSPNRSQGTQMPENSTSRINLMNELLKGPTRQSTNGTKVAKSAFGNFNINSYPVNVSEKIKDRFTKLNIKPKRVEQEDFKIYLECKQFDISDVKVRIEGDYLVVRCKHQCTLDNHGMVWREFKRRWLIPQDVERDEFKCLLDRNNILIIQAPRKPAALDIPVEIEKLKDWKTQV